MSTPPARTAALETGVFTLSLDFELIWGTQDLFGPEGFRRACEIERAVVIDRLLELLRAYEVPATWCVLGHLMLERCDRENGRAHPEIVRPAHPWVRGDWFAHDPGGTEQAQPLWLGRSLVEKIRACPVPQEIGCHSFSHVIFGDRGCSAAAAESDLAACVQAAEEMGLEMRSFAFPRNRVGHLELVKQHGFRAYRGPGETWYEQEEQAGLLGRLAHLWDVWRASAPPTVMPELTPSGLWNIPGSMIYFPMHGLRRWIPVSRRVARARRGLDEAVRSRRVFHLWFHPTNLADQTDAMFDGLHDIFEHAAMLRDQRRMAFRPMSALVPQAEGL
jgi:peptidoglycan/xylan/chitin deacetylase (PgdA/CDA1 family)